MFEKFMKWLQTPPKTKNERWAIQNNVLDAYLEGHLGYFKKEANPHALHTAEHEAWEKGSSDAEDHTHSLSGP